MLKTNPSYKLLVGLHLTIKCTSVKAGHTKLQSIPEGNKIETQCVKAWRPWYSQ